MAPKKKADKSEASSPWTDNEANPFCAPWSCQKFFSEGSHSPSHISLIDAGSAVFAMCQIEKPDHKVRSPLSHHDFTFMVNTVNACTEVRPLWDYESARLIAPVFMAALEVAEILRDLKSSPKASARHKALCDWGASVDDLSWMKKIDNALKWDWDEKLRAQYFEHQQKEKRYYVFKILGRGWSRVETREGQAMLDFWAVAGAGTRTARYAYWNVLLESMNAFFRLGGHRDNLPKAFPVLVRALRKGQGDLSRLAQTLQRIDDPSASRLKEVRRVLREAFDCFDFKKNRTRELICLPTDERREIYRQRQEIFSSSRPSKGRQLDLFAKLRQLHV